MPEVNNSMSLANPHPANFNATQKAGLAVTGIGILTLFLAWTGIGTGQALTMLVVCLISIAGGGLIYTLGTYSQHPAGIKNNRNYFSAMSSRGAIAWIAGIVITGFYVCLYFFPQYVQGLIALFEPLQRLIHGGKAAPWGDGRWFTYGALYTIAVLVMGFKFIYKYRHNNYQIIRTISVMIIQLGLSFLIPGILYRLYNYEPTLSYFWPLSYRALFPSDLSYMAQQGNLGMFVIFWGLVFTFIVTPVFTYFFGKRWYCSWFCGCGGLAETAGDPFRHLSDKSLFAWKVERWLIHSVLVIITLITALLLADSAVKGKVLGDLGPDMAKAYGFLIGNIFSGVIGVGFYPIMGSRVWCRFGCPMAAYMGLIQRFKSRFRITTNGAQCISCGNCSTYCEMGIDVRWYAQRGQNIVRASCVGCGICSAVCPRGVLKLESGPDNHKRLNNFFGSDELKILS
jgi:Pyruvate/2-oxoacid:ferredoxin oxidoreductase delta subunit